MFNESILKEIDGIKERYPDSRSALIPSLYIAQREYGWLSNEALRFVADNLNLPEATVRATASFYSLFKNKPTGRHLVQLCTNVSCMILGSEKLKDFLGSKYGLEPGGTTADGRFSLIIVECIGACDDAPSMLVNEDSYGNLTEQNIDVILGKYM
jgi:NADH-quinone oxidoreductase E subunit